MKVWFDTDAQILGVEDAAGMRTHGLYSREAFNVLSEHWLRVGWSQKYSYRFTWLGRPIVQLPEDVLRVQEAIHHLAPDVIIETGVAHGGSLILYASICQALGKGRVVGIDIEIRPANRAAIESHVLAPRITLVEGSSTHPAVLAAVQDAIRPGETVMVLLDSNHSYAHVLSELRAYAGFVSPGSYLVVQDGVMRDLADVPGGHPEWQQDNPARATADFLAQSPDFVRKPVTPVFDESGLDPTDGPTYWPDGWLQKRDCSQ
jgi:cephalosporin hydroxylase